MPVLETLGILAGIIGAGTSTGLGIHSAIEAGKTPDAAPAPAPLSAAQNVADEVAKRAATANTVNQNIPDLTDRTSGSLSDQSYQTAASSAAGVPGSFGAGGFDLDSLQKLLGGGQPSSPNITGGSTGQNPDLLDIATNGGGGLAA